MNKFRIGSFPRKIQFIRIDPTDRKLYQTNFYLGNRITY